MGTCKTPSAKGERLGKVCAKPLPSKNGRVAGPRRTEESNQKSPDKKHGHRKHTRTHSRIKLLKTWRREKMGPRIKKRIGCETTPDKTGWGYYCTEKRAHHTPENKKKGRRAGNGLRRNLHMGRAREKSEETEEGGAGKEGKKSEKTPLKTTRATVAEKSRAGATEQLQFRKLDQMEKTTQGGGKNQGAGGATGNYQLQRSLLESGLKRHGTFTPEKNLGHRGTGNRELKELTMCNQTSILVSKQRILTPA